MSRDQQSVSQCIFQMVVCNAQQFAQSCLEAKITTARFELLQIETES